MKIVILYTDNGPEKLISIASAKRIYSTLKKLGYSTSKIPYSFETLSALSDYSLVINLVYGKEGEDGTISAILSNTNISYLGPSTKNCLMTYNKLVTKHYLLKHGIRTPRIGRGKYSLIFKPLNGGSSKQIFLSHSVESKFRKLPKNNYFYEEYLPGREFCSTAIKDRNKILYLPIIEIKKKGNIFNFKEKYKIRGDILEAPAKISHKLENEILTITRKCFKIFDCRFYIKVDLVLDTKNRPNVIEIDGIPGFGPKSILPKAAETKNISFVKLMKILIHESTSC